MFPVRDGLPVHILASHPREDAAKVAALQFTAVTAAATLYRASTVLDLEGFDPIYVNGMEDVDLCLRATASTGQKYAVAPGSVIEHHESKTPGRGARIPENRRIFLSRWRGRLPEAEHHLYDAVDLAIAAIGLDAPPYAAPRPVLVPAPRGVTHDLHGRSVPRLRWSIKNSANPGLRGDTWGDTHFCEALAEGLRAVGQEAVVVRHGSHDGPSSIFDDVVLAIRGLDRANPQPGRINILWVISHPDEVTVDEIAGFDLVFAASRIWSERMSRLSGRQVLPLHQATDPRVFHPNVDEHSRTDDVVFVGQARHDRPRAIVMDALQAGLSPRVWGPRWQTHLDPKLIEAPYFPNERLGDLYRRSAVVLNDHWEDMSRDGFIANRIFDAVASGARVVSDPVDGIAELFEGAVLEYREASDLVALSTPAGRLAAFPDDTTRLELAQRIGAEHSFVARAQELLEATLPLLQPRFEASPETFREITDGPISDSAAE